MKLVDLRYKGIRVRKKHIRIFNRYLMGVVGLSLVAVFVFGYFFGLFIDLSDIVKVLLYVGLSLLVCVLLSFMLLFLLFPVTKRLLYLQRSCKLLYDSQFYIVNNFVDNNMMSSKDKKMKREIIYFPRCYVKVKRKKFFFTIQLDGSKFHQSGSYEKMSGTLQQRFGMELVGIEEKNSYLTYSFDDNYKANRISVNDVTVKGSTIHLMKNVDWNIEKVPHALIVGGTGGGKTYLLQILIQAFAKMGADIRIGDPKNSDLSDNSEVLKHVYADSQDIVTMVENVTKLMEQRYKDIKLMPNYSAGHNYAYYDLKPIFVIVDEYVAWLSNIPKKADRDVVLGNLRQIILKGRQVGVFGIFCTQRPDAKYLEGDIRDQLGLRVSVGKLTSDGYRMTFGKTDQELRNKGNMKARGYIDMDGYDYIKGFYSPTVPENYQFVEQLARIVNLSPPVFVAERRKQEGEQIDLDADVVQESEKVG